MQTAQPSLLTRDDTFLGVCQGLGEDFGFNPLWLRMAFAVPLLFNPMLAVAVYLGFGVLVLLTRLIGREPRASVATVAAAAPQPSNTNVPETVPLAA